MFKKKKKKKEVGQIEHEISTFSVPCRKVNLLLPGTSSRQKKTRFLAGTSPFLPAGVVGGEINSLPQPPNLDCLI